MSIKAISLHQPWATLVAIGAKHFETRSWYTRYRGPLVIHATRSSDFLFYMEHEPWKGALERAGFSKRSDLSFGAALCMVDLSRVVPTSAVRYQLSVQEYMFGDYTTGRFAWELENCRRFEPVPMVGHQRLWNFDGDTKVTYIHS